MQTTSDLNAITQIQSLMQSGRISEAHALCVKYCTPERRHPGLWCLSSVIHGQLNQFAVAEQHARRAIELAPNYVDAHYSMAVALLGQRRMAESEASLKACLKVAPQHVGAVRVLGMIYGQQKRWIEEIDCYRRALQTVQPRDSIDIQYALGKVLNTIGHNQEALACFRKVLAIAPNHVPALFGQCVCQIPVIYNSEDELIQCRKGYTASLNELKNNLLLQNLGQIHQAASAVGDQPNFYLAYQGYNDKQLQTSLGQITHKIQSARYPQWSQPFERPPIPEDGRLKIGFVSRFFYNHSNWKMPLKGWVERLDRSRFRLYGYYTGLEQDRYTAEARELFDHFHEGHLSVEALAQMIRQDNLHVLIYPEVGMDQLTIKLASLRLAPVQCSSWGHPETSGFPTIDYFLSSDLMEPDNADEHYTEKLVRLPNTSLYYVPVDIEPDASTRETFGLRDDAMLYFCSQSLFKYLPRYDDVFAKIAVRVPSAQFAFIKSPHSEQVSQLFENRLRASFERHDLRLDGRVVFLPRLSSEQYQAVNRMSDVFLDSIGWSGCNSTMEAIAHNKPIVTLPGDLMRGRHSYAFLRQMGLDQGVAKNVDDYIVIAVELGLNEGVRNQHIQAIKDNKHKMYRDDACIDALCKHLWEWGVEGSCP